MELRVGVEQRLPVPQPDVVDGFVVVLQRLVSEPLLYGEWLHRDLPQIVGFLRQVDVPLKIRRLQLQLARLHVETLEHAGQQFAEQERTAEDHCRGADEKPICAQPHIGPRDNGGNDGEADQQPEYRQFDMDVGVAGPDHDAVVVVEQQVAVQHIRQRLHREIGAKQRRAVGEYRRREPPRLAVQIDLSVQHIDRTGDGGARQQDQHHPVLERAVDWQREQIESDVLAEQRIVLAVRNLVDEPQDQLPFADLRHGDQQCDDQSGCENQQAPWQQSRYGSEHASRRRR
jgi:hypothetical protein